MPNRGAKKTEFREHWLRCKRIQERRMGSGAGRGSLERESVGMRGATMRGSEA